MLLSWNVILQLSGDDAWECPHCHKQQMGATKTIGLWSLPDVLVIHLKRFRQVIALYKSVSGEALWWLILDCFQEFKWSIQYFVYRCVLNWIDIWLFWIKVGLRRTKLSTLVDFPVRDLDMSPHVVRRHYNDGDGTEMVYELSGVLNHYGNMQGGHYTGE